MRPDLPLILIIVAAGAALALFADPKPAAKPTSRAAGAPAAEAPDAVDDFLSDFDPALVDCFGRIGVRDAAAIDPDDPKAAVDVVAARVERQRDLEFEHPVEARFLAPEALRARLEELVAKELPPGEVAREGEVLEQLGAIPPASDLNAITEEALGSQVVGLYDTRTGELLVQSAGEVDAEEEITVAHELEHALADQALGIHERVGTRAEVDRELAYASVVEGDATLLMERYALAYVGLADQLSVGESVPAADEFAALPDYVQRSLVFPYLEGLRLVCHRYLDGGWEAVDQLYDRPPAGTNEVIFPDRYGLGLRTEVELPPAPGPGWESVVRRELGAAELEWLLQAPGGDPGAALPDTRALVFGWAGGELELWERGDERALAIALAELEGTDTLCGAVGAWYRAGWPEAQVEPGTAPIELEFTEPGRSAVLACTANEVRMGVAPDLETASRLTARSTITRR
jgi:hypothetical protein